MRFPFFSLRTGILAYLGFLIVTAMLLVNVVMVKFEERDLVEAKLETGRLLLHILTRQIGEKIGPQQIEWDRSLPEHPFLEEVRELVRRGGFSDALIVNREGAKLFDTGSWASGPRPVRTYSPERPGGARARRSEAERDALSLTARTLEMRKWTFDFSGSTWGVIWPAHERINLSGPLFAGERLMGAVTIGAHLGPLYAILRKSEKTILLYIFVNTIILVLFGVFLLSRAVIRPIHRLLGITDQFEEGEPVPSFGDVPRNEIGQLFRSLNGMLRRLEENKQELRTHISSLEKANQEIKKAQAEIIRSEKAASVGRLATGVAHEIGNPIGIILGYLELLKGEDIDEEERKDFLDRIESELTRIGRIIKQLLDFSRPSTAEQRPADVHKMIRETVDMLVPQPIMAHVEIETALDATRDTVWAGPDQLKQVFLNIILNSADAMQSDAPLDGDPRRRVLSIRTANKDDSIEIIFADTGKGIPAEELVRVFDPFYTTKEPGKGTGLGLYVSYRIIEELGGSVRADSSPGQGTTITINIPLQKENKP